MKIAIVHDWLTLKGGAEACLEEFLELYPQADLFCVVDFLPEDERAFLKGHRVTTSFIQRMPWAAKRYRSYLPFMPLAIEQLDVTGYDLVISASAAVAKGVITGPDQVHVSYIHSPIRYAWDLQHQYLREAGLTKGMKSVVARVILHYIRMWDTRTANGVDYMIANSEFVARRIRKAYGRTAKVIHPPVNLDRFNIDNAGSDAKGNDGEDFYVTVSRMVPYKRIPLIVEAFAKMPDRHLIVIGDGPEMAAVRAVGAPNVTVIGRQPDEVVVSHLQRAKAFLFAAEEDFGIAPLEAQACGTPVIAYGKGGALETIRGQDGDGQTGVFFREQTADSIVVAVEHFERRHPAITPDACRANAARFSTERFRREFSTFVESVIAHNRGECIRFEAGAYADAGADRSYPDARPAYPDSRSDGVGP
ncbi:glycosyltransferase involved in cell wall biosynthesis [Sphingomonas sp. BK036]|uniref:glycosyltransferase family 4 protein n=1 Tax=Sphingomonas sp. BK036 TaxID=2512122 RepID=UPI00102943AF|nr:glycosyltransferase family 4 protein [Sphingomonas sp. BK036]RZT44855.1 glycosyltransferase involved in cell wall biosynthesis [Sphingomonas sp. BK036]